MKCRRFASVLPLSILSIIMTLLLPACAGNSGGGAGESHRLRYGMRSGDVLDYRSERAVEQILHTQGGDQVQRGSETAAYAIACRRKGRDIGLRTSLEEMTAELELPQSRLIPDLEGIRGQVFTLKVDRQGGESVLGGQDRLLYELTPGIYRSAASSFQAFFPDLPRRPLKVGDRWSSRERLDDSDSRYEVTVHLVTDYELLAYESCEGNSCARIGIAFAGLLLGEGEDGDLLLRFHASLSGAGEFVFDLGRGLMLSLSNEGMGEGLIAGSGSQVFEIPFTRTISSKTRLENSSMASDQPAKGFPRPCP